MMATDFLGLSILPHNDVHLHPDGRLAMATGSLAIAQHARQRLKFWQGEWFLDDDAGVDWLRHGLGGRAEEVTLAESVVKATILDTPGVTSIVEFDATFDARSRGLRVARCVVRTIFDDELDIGAP